MKSKYNMHLLSTDSLMEILKERQNDYLYEAIIEVKQELEKRDIDTSHFSIIKYKKVKKSVTWDSLISALLSISLIVGFISLDYLLFKYGLEDSDFTLMFFGVLLGILTLFIISIFIFREDSRVSEIIGFFITFIFIAFSYILGACILIGLLYLPFSDKNLSVDLGILVLKDKFIRFIIVLLDIYIIYNITSDWKERLSNIINKIKNKN